MRVKQIVYEDFTNYKLPSLFLGSCFCDFKCCIEQNIDKSICQNEPLYHSPIIDIPDKQIYNQFINNSITKSCVIGGMEPLIQINEVIGLISYFRSHDENCPFIIYTGYYKQEISKEIDRLAQFSNIIVKFGRFHLGQESHYDEILGVNLASNNQYAEVIS